MSQIMPNYNLIQIPITKGRTCPTNHCKVCLRKNIKREIRLSPLYKCILKANTHCITHTWCIQDHILFSFFFFWERELRFFSAIFWWCCNTTSSFHLLSTPPATRYSLALPTSPTGKSGSIFSHLSFFRWKTAHLREHIPTFFSLLLLDVS
jgi:hypothetical protein